jgi:signal transduction histidine kinase
VTANTEQAIVDVHNCGGIPKEVLPRLFEPFRSGRQYGSRGGGLGLGLFIARAIARAHGGSLEVDSSNDATTFQLVLPR